MTNLLTNTKAAGSAAATLNATGRAIAGVGNVLASSATNKLLDEPSGFSWANVAASAVGSALGSPIVGESGSGNFFMDVGNSILGAAAGYATKKIVNNEGSWNNQDVLVDAFGNAIGNSVVRAGQQSYADRVAEQQKMSNAIGAIGQQAVDTRLNARIDQVATQQAENLSQQVMQNLPVNGFEEVTSFANSGAGLDFVNSGLASLQNQNSDLLARKATLKGVQGRIDGFAQQQGRYQLSEQRTTTPTVDFTVTDDQLKDFLGGNYLSDEMFGIGSDQLPNYKPTIVDQDYKWRQDLLNDASLSVGGATVNAIGLQKMLDTGWGTVRNIGNKANLFPFDPLLTASQDWAPLSKGMSGFGNNLGVIGGFTSALTAMNETYGNSEGFDGLDAFREFGKAGVDVTAGLTGVSRFASTLGRFSPVGVAYTAADLAVQFSPDYTVQYGSHAGEVKTGWTKLFYAQGDVIHANQQIDPNWKPFGPGKF
ncbi:hypothetical protein OPS25_07210 [Alteromonas ponticola]|uniref:Uncharacterized protein n=1 Tax=Alteromonas aquimaris TaxID=2998417 RepID=A0ABT3P684_9ALTE|nr:hypothetical protein [Alteromonas aquimaris]MCW8108280.1 hypothetical protein [Alteromonas aquimaris]